MRSNCLRYNFVCMVLYFLKRLHRLVITFCARSEHWIAMTTHSPLSPGYHPMWSLAASPNATPQLPRVPFCAYPSGKRIPRLARLAFSSARLSSISRRTATSHTGNSSPDCAPAARSFACASTRCSTPQRPQRRSRSLHSHTCSHCRTPSTWCRAPLSSTPSAPCATASTSHSRCHRMSSRSRSPTTRSPPSIRRVRASAPARLEVRSSCYTTSGCRSARGHSRACTLCYPPQWPSSRPLSCPPPTRRRPTTWWLADRTCFKSDSPTTSTMRSTLRTTFA